MTNSLKGRVALVTGGSSGIGAAIALELAERGADVMITGRNASALEASAARHPRIVHTVADIGRAEDVARSIDEARRRWDKLDILVNNAGILEIMPLAQVTRDHVERTLGTNVTGLIETTRLALPLLRSAKGNIVNVATVVADQPFANMSVYCASKAAVLALTRSWAQELGAEGIRVNAVSPGPIETAMFSTGKLGIGASELEALAGAVLGLVPLKRFGKPEEVAHVVAFLASAEASFVTGAEYTVGGGIEA
jgi:NAD(P)-dependent dehydrogenase (short-subunit alcohol dehydrogenase family)